MEDQYIVILMNENITGGMTGPLIKAPSFGTDGLYTTWTRLRLRLTCLMHTHIHTHTLNLASESERGLFTTNDCIPSSLKYRT